MQNTVSWTLQMAVREGHLADARALMIEMVRATREEPGTLEYEWSLDRENSAWHINERFADSDAAVAHLDNFGATFVDRFLTVFEPTSLYVYGEPSAEARAALDLFGAVYLGTLGGFNRYR